MRKYINLFLYSMASTSIGLSISNDIKGLVNTLFVSLLLFMVIELVLQHYETMEG